MYIATFTLGTRVDVFADEALVKDTLDWEHHAEVAHDAFVNNFQLLALDFFEDCVRCFWFWLSGKLLRGKFAQLLAQNFLNSDGSLLTDHISELLERCCRDSPSALAFLAGFVAPSVKLCTVAGHTSYRLIPFLRGGPLHSLLQLLSLHSHADDHNAGAWGLLERLIVRAFKVVLLAAAPVGGRYFVLLLELRHMQEVFIRLFQ